jgi:hypothetical protein
VRPPCRRREHRWRVAAQAALPAEPYKSSKDNWVQLISAHNFNISSAFACCASCARNSARTLHPGRWRHVFSRDGATSAVYTLTLATATDCLTGFRDPPPARNSVDVDRETLIHGRPETAKAG